MVRVGLIGAGRMGKGHYLRLRQIPDAHIVGIADIDESRAKELAEPIGATAYRDYEQLLAREDLDAVYVVTPVQWHAEPAIAVAKRGVALFLEKPMAWTLQEAKRIADAVDQAGIISSVGYQWRTKPVVEKMRQLLMGEPIALLRAHWYWTIPLVPDIRNKDTGGGQIFDQATHPIDLMRLFAGEVKTVQAAYTLNARKGEFDNWDGYSVTLTFESGAVGSVATTYALFRTIGEPPTLDVVTKEMLLRLTPKQLEIRTPEGREVLDDHREDIDTPFIQAVANKDQSFIKASVRESLNSLAITLAANHAAQIGETVDFARFVQG
ncbi:MAG: Gfo/Idh/MocA family protein [Bacilli bacterium]